MLVNIPYMDPMGDVMSVRNDANFIKRIRFVVGGYFLSISVEKNSSQIWVSFPKFPGVNKNFGLYNLHNFNQKPFVAAVKSHVISVVI